jgi:hypothetical protein
MYLGAHPDGLLIAEDNDTNHHDIVWKILPGAAGGIALQSCHGTFLTARPNGSLDSNSRQNTPESGLHVEQCGPQVYTLRDWYGMYLSAVPPVQGQRQVLGTNNPQMPSARWEIVDMGRGPAPYPGMPGKFF